jgi:hypothetical protein
MAAQSGYEPLPIYISHARADADFVDELAVELEMHGHQTEVYRPRNTNSPEWYQEVEQKIDACAVLLLVVSPSVFPVQQPPNPLLLQQQPITQHVAFEYRKAFYKNKVVIPLYYQTIHEVSQDLNGIPWVDARTGLQGAVPDLLVALGSVALSFAGVQPPPQIAHIPNPWRNPPAGGQAWVPAQPPPFPFLRQRETYLWAAKFNSYKHTSHAFTLWERVLGSSQISQELMAQSEIEGARATIQLARQGNLTMYASKMHQACQWHREIVALKRLRDDFASPNPEKIRRAEENQTCYGEYERAEMLLEQSDFPTAVNCLRNVWRLAPHYGDPKGLLKRPEIRAALSFWERGALFLGRKPRKRR